MMTKFVVGEQYTNDQIRFTLNVENLGGVRPSIDSDKNLRHLAIMTAAREYDKSISDNPYSDRIEKDILIFTAQGRTGNQEISGRNKRILEQYSAPVPFYCFSNEGRQFYRFLGLLELLRHYQEDQLDAKRELRRVWIFEFRIHSEVTEVPLEYARELTAGFLRQASLTATPEEREIVHSEQPAKDTETVHYNIEDLRSRLMQINPYRFEALVGKVIQARGFQNVIVTPTSQDGGIDVNATVPDSDYFFSKTHVQFQIKRWRHSVGSVEINNFRGALHSTAKGVFITTSHFTKAAIKEAEHAVKPSIALIDGVKFARLVGETAVDLND